MRLAVLCLSLLPGLALAETTPMHHGVVFFCPQEPAEAVKELERIKADGFDLLKFASWAWTLPKPGSPVEARAQAVLDWCDRNGMAFVLLHNVQYGSKGEGGGLEDQALHPEQALPLVTDWARVLAGHPSVLGVILGNEVGPAVGSPEKTPRWWSGFQGWLHAKYGDVATLNAAWGTDFASFQEVRDPAQAQTAVDLRSYAGERFAQFYGYLFDHAFRPVLGEKLYGAKTSLDPFLQRACGAFTMTCWDDVVSEYPPWRLKLAADTVHKPVFNSELHLYHDNYAFRPSVERSRYRYFLSAILGEYLTASFAWGQWQKPAISTVHAATPGILRDLRRLEPQLRQFHEADEQADLRVLVTRAGYYGPWETEQRDHPLAVLCARMSCLGKPWRYLVEDELATLSEGTLVCGPEPLSQPTAQALASLPDRVRLLFTGSLPTSDDYGRPLPDPLLKSLAARATVTTPENPLQTIGVAPGLPEAYQRTGDVPYLQWDQQRGHFDTPETICLLEARRVTTADRTLVCVINHTREPQTAPLPWAKGTLRDLTSGATLTPGQMASMTFSPLAINLYECDR
ncbi:beta-galactosidase [bacterium]|nr:beta-galactosidase [bacterium]